MQRAGDKNFDKFELYALNNVFRVPPELAQEPVAVADESGIDAELEALWAQLYFSAARVKWGREEAGGADPPVVILIAFFKVPS